MEGVDKRLLSHIFIIKKKRKKERKKIKRKKLKKDMYLCGVIK